MGNKTPKEELSPQHDRFCREFVYSENQTRAYMKVYPGSGYESARRSASALMTNPDIKERIEILREERNKRLEITADRVLRELAKIAFSNPQDLYDENGKLKKITDLDPDTAAGISQIEVVNLGGALTGSDLDGAVMKIKMWDKKGANELLGKNLKLWKEVGSAENPAEVKHSLKGLLEEITDNSADLVKGK